MKPTASTSSSGLLAAAALGGVAMLAAGWMLGAPKPAAARTAEAAGPAEGKRAERRARPYGRYQPPHHAVARVKAIRAMADPGEQMRATIALVNSIPLSEIGDWLEGRWFPNSGDYNLSLFNKLLEKRWQAEDPDGLTEWRLEQGSGWAWGIMNDWAQNDPERLLAHFRENPNRSRELEFLSRIAGNHPDIAVERIQELIRNGVPPDSSDSHQIGEALKRAANKDPELAKRLLESLPPAFAKELEKGLVSNDLQRSFSEAMRSLWDRADGWDLLTGAYVDGKGTKLLAELDQLPESWKDRLANQPHSFLTFDNAKAWVNTDFAAAGFTEEQEKRILHPVLFYLSRSDPKLAIEKANEIDFKDDARRYLLNNIFSNLKPDQAEGLLPLLASEEEREKARALLPGAASDGESPSRDTRPETPDEWLEQAGQLTDDNIPSSAYTLLNTLRRWDREKIDELTRNFSSLPEATKSQISKAVNMYGDQVDYGFRAEVLRYQLGTPAEDGRANQGAQQASELAVSWMRSDPDAAAAWVSSLPSGESRQWAQKNLARNWALYDPDSMEQWVNTLPAGDRSAVRGYLTEKR